VREERKERRLKPNVYPYFDGGKILPFSFLSTAGIHNERAIRIIGSS
jgi:hypothetical protein